ncbi:MAG: hypothetical protein L3K26_09380, partial [Candidatus Hydrogenedentes bacterium]|nr:hypothetical protein [Candidatus Hydrogenedentota bacterium]
ALTSFESPSTIAGPEEEAVSQHPPEKRVWMEGVRETAADGETERCARCSRTFRGAWDRHETAKGVLCHLCAVQADESYQPPSQNEKRELYRPAPPKKVAAPQAAGASEEQARKKKGLLILAVVGTVTVVGAMVFPVEVWVAEFFTSDMEQAQDLPAAWYWLAVVLGFLVSALGQGGALYATLGMMDLLYDEPRDNLFAVAYLGIAFAILDLIAFGMILGLLFFVVKLMMISERFHLRAEGGAGFVIIWFLVSLILGPAMVMVDLMLRGIVAGIAM